MTVVDFRSGGFDGARDDARGYARHDYADDYAERSPYARSRADQDYYDDDWNDGRYAADADVPVSERNSLAGRFVRTAHYVGALGSLAVFASLGIWGYQLVVRDVSGVPVIRALEGAARTAPENPGGELTERTGLAVNAVAGGESQPVADRVALAPSATGLTEQDVPMGQLGATAQAPVSAEEQAVPDSQPRVVAALTDAQLAAEKRAAEEAARAAAEVEAIARNTVTAARATEGPVNEALTDENGNPAADAAITAALAEAGAGNAVAVSARPAARPVQIAMADTQAEIAPVDAVAEPAPMPVADVAKAEPVKTEPSKSEQAKVAAADVEAPVVSAKVSSGAPLVQIGAFDSDKIAQSEWSRISGRYGDLFAGKAPVVVKHQAGGRTFWRLRVAGFDNRDDARKFCAALAKAGTDCIPATAK